MRQMNPNIYPPGGHKFRERDGTVFKAESWKAVERKIIRYRRDGQFPLGNPWEEIMAQACGENPGLCGEVVSVPKTGGMTFNQRILEWLAWAVGRKRINAVERVSAEVAAARAEVCAVCPKQRSLNKACLACISGVGTARKAIFDGGKTPHDSLLPCAELFEDTATSVHMVLGASNNPALPLNCWRRR